MEGWAALLMQPLELHGRQVGEPGFTRLDLSGTELRVSEHLGVDISSRTDIDFYTQHNHTMIGGFAFPGDRTPTGGGAECTSEGSWRCSSGRSRSS